MISRLFSEILFISISTSVLIAVFLLFKILFREKLTPMVKYFIWLLLIIKLCIPFQLYPEFNPIEDIKANENITMPVNQDSSLSEGMDTGGPGVSADINTGDESPDTLVDSGTAVSDARKTLSESVSIWIKPVSIIWLVVFLIFLLMMCIIEFITWGKISRSLVVEDDRLLEMLEGIQQKLKLFKNIEIREVSDFNSPAVYGLFKPILIVPDVKALLELDSRQIKNILIHELTHIHHYDNLIRIVFSIIKAVHWFNPFIWIMSFNMKNAQEMKCDKKVLGFIPQSNHRNYADLILDLYSSSNNGRILKIPAFLNNVSHMKDRIVQILFFRKTKPVLTYLGTALAVVIFLFSFIIFTPAYADFYDEFRDASVNSDITVPGQAEQNESIPENTALVSEQPDTSGATDEISKANINLTEDGYVIFSDPVFAEMIASEINIPVDKIEPSMLNEVYELEIWGDDITINQHYMTLINYFGSDGYAVDYNGSVIRSYGDISSLEDVELLVNLRILSINMNDISELPDFSSIKQLKILRLMSNGIKDISMLSTLQNCSEIYLCNNRITDIEPLSKLDSLGVLWLGSNNIIALPEMSSMSSLTELRLEKNNIMDIAGLSGLPAIRNLSLGMNAIIDINPLSNLTKLNSLAILSNLISDISPLSNLEYMNELFINNNKITDISPLTSMKSLSFLNASGNRIPDISPFLEMTSLRELYFRDNLAYVDESIYEKLNWISDLVLD